MRLFAPSAYAAHLFFMAFLFFASLGFGEESKKKPKRFHREKRVDYKEFLQEVDAVELPEAYRPPYKGIMGIRPITFALIRGGRAPGIGFLFDYNFNRLGIGFSASYLSFYGLFKEIENRNLLGTGQAFWNAYLVYNFIPFNFSPYIILGVELGEKTKHSFDILCGLGMEFRVFPNGPWTVLLEYVYHRTVDKAYPGLSLGFAF